MKRTTLGISALVLMLAGSAFVAAEPWQAGQPETRAEAQARAGHLFDKLDLNHDGKLDQADRAVKMNEMFERIDTNHDGVISRAEFAAAHEHMMGRDHGPDRPGMDHPGMDHPGMDGEHGGRRMGHWGYDDRELRGLVMLILHRADPGHTGTVTRDGFVRAALALFDQADTNHDGVLTPEEHRAAAQAMRQHMRAHWDRPKGAEPAGPGGDLPQPPPPAH